MSTIVADAAAALHANSVRACFGVSGSGLSWQLATALEKHGVSYHSTAHEAAAAIMAGAFGRRSGNLGCSLSIRGPGLANMIPGMLSNRYEQWPAISISEAYDPAVPSPRMHKRLDHRSVIRSLVKGYGVGSGPVVEQLATLARAEIPGQVHIDLVSRNFGSVESFIITPREASGHDRDWDEIRLRIDASRRPLLVVGSLATRAYWGRRLCELNIPILTTVAAKGVVDERIPIAAGVFTGDGKSLTPEAAIVPEADLIVGLGLRNLEVLTPKPFPSPLVALDSAGDSSLLNGFDPAVQISAAPDEQFDCVLEALASKAWGTDLVTAAVGRVRAELTRDEWLPGRVLVALQDLAGEDVSLVTDTGAFCTVAEHVWHAGSPMAFMASANGRYMGTSFPMAIGCALAHRPARIICVAGDGGIRPFWAEIKLAIAERLPILFLLMTDGRYGSIAAAASAPDLIETAIAVPLASWFRAAESFGCEARQIKSLGALADVVKQWRDSNGPLFVEAPFDAKRYAAMTAGIR